MGMKEMLEGRKPFFLEGTGTEGVLCLHGFTGSPGNYRKLAPRLQTHGFSVLVPLLPGHGTTPQEMAHYTHEDWLRAAENSYEELQKKCSRIHIVGLSLGGGLSSVLAARHPEAASVTLLAPAFRMNPFILNRLGIDMNTAAEAPAEAMVQLPTRQPSDTDLDECIFGYNGFPVRSMASLHKIGIQARQAYPDIRIPICLLYTLADKVVDPAACAEFARLNPPEVIQVFQDCEHNLLLDNRREEVYRAVEAYLLSHRVENNVSNCVANAEK